MPNEILEKNGTAIVFANSADFGGSPIARTHQINMTSLGAGAARQGDKVDLGATRAARYDVVLRPEFDVAPTSPGKQVSVWWAPSPHATAGTANPGGVSGSDSAYTGTSGDSLADSILQLQYIGALQCTSDVAPTVQQQAFTFFPECRYGTPVVWNEADQAFEGDGVEMSLIFIPVIDEVQ